MIRFGKNAEGLTTYQAVCGFCPAVAGEPQLKMSLAVLDAIEAGWFLGRRYYCQACQAVRKHDLIGAIERA
jgi:hypothetical protein